MQKLQAWELSESFELPLSILGLMTQRKPCVSLSANLYPKLVPKNYFETVLASLVTLLIVQENEDDCTTYNST